MNFSIQHFVNLQKEIQADLPLEESLSRILKDLDKEVKYNSLGIFLKVPRTELYRLKISRNISHHFAKDTIFTNADPLLEELHYFKQIGVDEYGFYRFEHDFSHLVITPIFYKKELYGFMFVDLVTGSFSEEKLEFIEFYGSVISTTVRIHALEDGLMHNHGVFDINKIYDFQPFVHKTSHSMKLMKRYNRDFSLAVLLIDNYKTLVQTQGEETITKKIDSIGNYIKDSLRTTDIIGKYHKNVLIITLPETNKKEAMLTINRIEKQYIDLIVENKVVRGWGIAEPNDEIKTVMDLIKEAQNAAKEASRKNQKF